MVSNTSEEYFTTQKPLDLGKGVGSFVPEYFSAFKDLLYLMIFGNCKHLPITVILNLQICEFPEFVLEFVLRVPLLSTSFFSVS